MFCQNQSWYRKCFTNTYRKYMKSRRIKILKYGNNTIVAIVLHFPHKFVAISSCGSSHICGCLPLQGTGRGRFVSLQFDKMIGVCFRIVAFPLTLFGLGPCFLRHIACALSPSFHLPLLILLLTFHITIHSITSHIKFNYIPSHFIIFHCIPSHFMTLHSIPFHSIQFHSMLFLH